MFDLSSMPDVNQDYEMVQYACRVPARKELNTAVNTTTSTIAYTAGNSEVMDESAMSLFITNDPKANRIKPVVLGTDIPILNIVNLYYVQNQDITEIKGLFPELNDEQIGVALVYYENHKKEIDTFLEDLAPDLSIAQAAQMAKQIIKHQPNDIIDADLGSGL